MNETRVAVLTIIAENPDAAERINALLHEYRSYIIGRMGLPYREKGISVICVVLDAPQTDIAALSGKIGRIPRVSAKTAYAKVCTAK